MFVYYSTIYVVCVLIFNSFFQTSEDEFRPPLKKRKVGRPRKNANPFDEVIKKHQKKEKCVSLSSSLSSNVSTIKIKKIETSSSSGQYKIKPKLKAEVKVCRYLFKIYLR